METFIKIPFTRRKQDKNIVNTIIKDMKVGFKYVVKEPFILKAMILAGVLNFILSPFLSVGVPIILREIMQSSDTMYGIGLGLVSFSTILGALTIGIFTKFFRIEYVVSLANCYCITVHSYSDSCYARYTKTWILPWIYCFHAGNDTSFCYFDVA